MRVHTIAEIEGPDVKPVTYGCGRVCAVFGCGTLLSMYNPSALCALHKERLILTTATGRNRARPIIEHRCVNADCGAIFLTQNPQRLYCSKRCRMVVFQRRRTERRAA